MNSPPPSFFLEINSLNFPTILKCFDVVGSGRMGVSSLNFDPTMVLNGDFLLLSFLFLVLVLVTSEATISVSLSDGEVRHLITVVHQDEDQVEPDQSTM